MVKVPIKKENKTYQDIYDTINQSNLKPGSPEDPELNAPNPLDELDQFEEKKLEEPPAPEMPETPMPPAQDYNYVAPQNFEIQRESSSQIQEIVESLIEEKWEEVLARVGDINLWKDRVNTELSAIKQEIVRTQTQFMNLQKVLLGRINDYNQNILNINSEMQALEKVFQKILEPLSENVKELSRITEKIKSKSK